jgi:hypothetical protein
MKICIKNRLLKIFYMPRKNNILLLVKTIARLRCRITSKVAARPVKADMTRPAVELYPSKDYEARNKGAVLAR